MAGVKGKSGGDRRSKKAQGIPEDKPAPLTREGWARLIDVLNRSPAPDEATKDPEAAGWRPNWDSPNLSSRLNTRKFAYMMRDGSPTQHVKYTQTDTLKFEGNLRLSLGEGMKIAMEKAEKRVSKRDH